MTASTEPTAAYGNNNPQVIVTGEHSGLANLVPGSPGTINPPFLNSAEGLETGGALAPNTYVYAVTDDFVEGGGESTPSETTPIVVSGSKAQSSCQLPPVCHAAQFKIYREVSGTNKWFLIGTMDAPTSQPPNSWYSTRSTTEVTGGQIELSFTDTGITGTPASAPPTSNMAVESPYPQNPNLVPAFEGVGIKDFGWDASKPYPNPTIPGSVTPVYPAGSTFVDAHAQAIPRYPTNIYYNVSTRSRRLTSSTTSIRRNRKAANANRRQSRHVRPNRRTSPKWSSDVDMDMLQHVMGNDPRPHYFHQPNLMG